MKIDNESGFKLNTFFLRNQLEQQPETDESTEVSLDVSQLVARAELPESSSSSMLANNFVHQGRERSRYVQGLLDGFQVENEFRNKMSGIIEGYSSLAGGAGSYAEANLIGQKAAEAAKDAVEEEVVEEETERLEEEREEFEEEIQEKIEEKAEDSETVDLEAGAEGMIEDVEKKAEEAVAPEEEIVEQAAADASSQDVADASATEEGGLETASAKGVDIVV
ncbi:hypothetical protein [Salidesulfovibrio onnuriiensis]|uniref:hypothetical protein n=1 Tax=Salidesulfovibrio onnuriiensis TaxID=2583823 RepID=UPI0011C7623A|nr:hypothetical protein [Salidesulfovibrio onnuriiensis]